MMAGQIMNGATQQPTSSATAQPAPAPVSGPHLVDVNAPLAVLNPIMITPALIATAVKWISGAVVAVVTVLTTANGIDRYLMPAKDSDLKMWVDVVKSVQTAQAEQKQAIERLTVAVDNLAGIVDEVKRATGGVKNAIRPVKPR